MRVNFNYIKVLNLINQKLLKKLLQWLILIVSSILESPTKAFNLIEAWQATYEWNANYAAARAHSS